MPFQDYFDLAPAYNPDTEQLVAESPFQVFAADDLAFATPLAVSAADSGAALSPLVSNSIGMLPAFRVEGSPTQVILKSGSFTTLLTSRYAAVIEAGLDPETVTLALAASTSAQTAATTAATAVTDAEAARDAAVVAKEAAQAVPATTDGVVTALLANEATQARQFLDTRIEDAIAAGGGGGGGATLPFAYYNGTAWSARPDVDVPVTWYSTAHPGAPEPPDLDSELGDIWILEP